MSSKDEYGDLTKSMSDLSEWMTNLPDYVADQPINNLAIPGSHDSGAYWIDPSTPLCPGISYLFSWL